MPALRRNAVPLLRQVGGKPHATNDDHEEASLPTPPASNVNKQKAPAAAKNHGGSNTKEQDIYADPLSSSDEDAPAALSKANKPSSANNASFKPSKQFRAVDKPSAGGGGGSRFKPPPGISSQSSSLGKRSSNESAGRHNDENDDPAAAAGSSDSDDKMVFSSQTSQQRKRPRAETASGQTRKVGNIHAPPPASSVNKYGRNTNTKRVFTSKDRKQRPAPGFKTTKGADVVTAAVPQGPTFKAAKGADVFAFGTTGNEDAAEFQQARGGRASDSPELSDLSELDSEVEEVDVRTLGLPLPKEYVAQTDCGLCGASVPLLLKQEFEDRYNHGKALSYRWQQRFCRYHKAKAARAVWREKGYPDIQWEKLEARLRGHHGRLVAVLEGREPSVYRERLQKVMESGSTRTAKSAFHNDKNNKAIKREEGELEVRPGYYGARGEKLMTEHILGHFAGRLRDLAVCDPLIASSGVAGGVSGFVQAVLVPEVAVELVREDMKVSAKAARQLLGESLEVGELLNEEAEEKVQRVESDDEQA